MTNKLDLWLSTRKIKRSAFAKAIGVSPPYVTLLCSDQPTWPGRDVATRIAEYTGGDITPNDFLASTGTPEVAA